MAFKASVVLIYGSMGATIIIGVVIALVYDSADLTLDHAFVQMLVLTILFVLDFCSGIWLIYLFTCRLYQLLKHSYEETYRAQLELRQYKKKKNNITNVQMEHSSRLHTPTTIATPTPTIIATITMDSTFRKTTVPFQSTEVDMLKTITKYTLLNGLCVTTKTLIEMLLGAMSIAHHKGRYLAFGVVANVGVCAILWAMYFQTSFGKNLYDTHCQLCHTKLQECVGRFSKERIKTEINLSRSGPDVSTSQNL
ncbi:hypothetical protein RFI_11537 [Reticulomyxa filosa]|uniref:Uncharacterized protein n=1 Tax=Reticulomyxa filosa TaxID=46433 RepID=X6NIP2_RETFI|nr:hypothetical protein RFI_11537 [Reticulomyxa filosa]|eukprot:ETO25599.1 hypothetical protein RFI_11537 [Reticulomyxa filosa]